MIDIRVNKTLEPEWMKKINDHVQDTLDIRNEYIEMMAMAYLKMTDVHPSEVELVEEKEGLRTRWYFRRKND